MKTELMNIAMLMASFLTLFGVVEAIYQFKKIQPEYTRKAVHIGAGLLTLLFPVMLTSHWSVLCITGSFAALLWVTKQMGFLGSIHNVNRSTAGSYYYPISIYACFLFYQYMGTSYINYFMPVLILALADAAAAIIGKRWPVRKYVLNKEQKSLSGSASFFCVASVVAGSLFSVFSPYLGWHDILSYTIGIALLTTLVEATSTKGRDNLFIPLTVMSILYFIEPMPWYV